jgi:hypothetical protein
MKLIEKFMLKRCSTEVQVMLTRMKERPEDFDYGTGWKSLVEVADNGNDRNPYTKIERKMIRAYWKECQVQRERKLILAQIMKETINPTKPEDYDKVSKRYSQALAKSMQSTAQVAQNGLLSGYSDPRGIYTTHVYPTQGRIV